MIKYSEDRTVGHREYWREIWKAVRDTDGIDADKHEQVLEQTNAAAAEEIKDNGTN